MKDIRYKVFLREMFKQDLEKNVCYRGCMLYRVITVHTQMLKKWIELIRKNEEEVYYRCIHMKVKCDVNINNYKNYLETFNEK